jgi:DNA-binding ferritin-like protein (Dps family)
MDKLMSDDIFSGRRRCNDLEAVSKASVDLKIIGQVFRKDMREFFDFLADENGKTFEKLYANNFDEVIAWLK